MTHCLIALCLTCAIAAAAGDDRSRRVTIDDFLNKEYIYRTTVSPDGEWIAATVLRSRKADELHPKPRIRTGEARCDLWLIRRDGTERRNLTEGKVDLPWLRPAVWSPDGGRIAMFGTEDGTATWGVYVWDMSTKKLKRISARSVANDYGISRQWDPAWISNTSVLAAVYPENLPEGFFSWLPATKARSRAVAAWEKAERGTEPAVSALESGVGRNPGELPPSGLPEDVGPSEIQAIDVVTGRSTTLAKVVLDDYHSTDMLLSPDRSQLAVLAGVDIEPLDPKFKHGFTEMYPISQNHQHSRLGFVSIAKPGQVRWVDGDNFMRMESWSPDGKKVAVRARKALWDIETNEMFSVEAATAKARRLLSDDYKVVSADYMDLAAVWTDDNRPVVRARKTKGEGVKELQKARVDWWRIEGGNVPTHLTAAMPSVPVQLHSTGRPNQFAGVADGDLWKIDAADGSFKNLTAAFEPKVADLSMPDESGQPAIGSPEIVLRTVEDGSSRFYRLSPDSDGTASAVKIPIPPGHDTGPDVSVTLDSFTPRRSLTLFREDGPNGSFLQSSDGRSSRFSELLALNQNPAKIAWAEQQVLIEYRGVDGQLLKGVVLLPPDYEEGKRYPLVTKVYGGEVFTEKLKAVRKDLELQLLAARGYAILLPSIPLPPEGTKNDNYLDIPKGVIPAVDKAIELGIADPDRLGVMGHSYGGYSTYVMVTYTNRFKAAIAMNGPSNQTSFWGEYEAMGRYSANPQWELQHIGNTESGQSNLAVPPYEDPWGYVYNSPLFQADRINTPLIIIHGDLDFVPITQAEQMFTALYRQGKRARFLRYWGEHHDVRSPENRRNMWSEIYAWLDEFLDISRDAKGDLVWDGEKLKSRKGVPPLKPEDFTRFDQITLKKSSVRNAH